MVEDMESRNGTTLSGLPLGGRVPLPESGVLDLGDGCEVAFQREGCLRLEVKSGMDLGAMAVAITTPTLLSEILPGGPALNISFQRGRPMVHAVTGGRGLKLNGSAASGMIQLIAGDRLEVDGAEAVRVGG